MGYITSRDVNRITAEVFAVLLVLFVVLLMGADDPSIGGVGEEAGPLFVVSAVVTALVSCMVALSYRGKSR